MPSTSTTSVVVTTGPNRREDVLTLLGHNGLDELSICIVRAFLTAVLFTRTHPFALSLRHTRPFDR
jgi:hypothetical protein